MALVSSFGRIIFSPRTIWKINNVKSSNKIVLFRNLLTTPAGAIYPEPKKVPFPFLKIILVLTPGVYIGAAIAKHGATILEENEIFVPSDDDEED